MRIRTLAIAAVLALALPACDSTADFEIGGTYSGSFDNTISGSNDAELTIPDTPSGNTFSFRYSLVEGGNDGPASTINGTGTYDHPAITLTFEGETVNGTVSNDGDTIRIDDGEGFIITLNR